MDAKPKDSSKHHLHGRGSDLARSSGILRRSSIICTVAGAILQGLSGSCIQLLLSESDIATNGVPIISGAKGRPIGAAEPASATLLAVLRLSTAFFWADWVGLAFMVRSLAVWSCRRFRADRVGLAFMVGAIVLVSLPSWHTRS